MNSTDAITAHITILQVSLLELQQMTSTTRLRQIIENRKAEIRLYQAMLLVERSYNATLTYVRDGAQFTFNRKVVADTAWEARNTIAAMFNLEYYRDGDTVLGSSIQY